MDRQTVENWATQIVDSIFKVHSSLGPGLLESAYQVSLAYELTKRGLEVQTEVPQPIIYDTVKLDIGYRLDMLVNHTIVIENKTVDVLLPVHQAQLITYLKLSGLKLGFLVNWNSAKIKDGIHRIVNGL
jgi:GxxExxY protein